MSMKLRLAGISAAAVLAGALSTGSPVLAATATVAHQAAADGLKKSQADQ